ncbi:MAG: glutamine-hydrolyzing carbamoyl-phosphate synthase small subunit [Acidimicrobiia bacterium]|nr:glutamine-hydrolyzing carbamoyl-phosphate synthase small subunit [Acidimicrobiia bacterium]
MSSTTTIHAVTMTEAALVLADGSVFEGEHIGAMPPGGIASGEVVFNTALVGYQEILSDPSYAGQIITFTYPHIGNYGVNATDDESRGTFARGVVVRDLARRPSNWRAEHSLDQYLRRNNLAGIAGLDTRRLTRLLRDTGAMPGAFGPTSGPGAVTAAALAAAAAAEPGTDGIDLVAQVTTAEPYTVGDGPRRVVAYDYGIKTTILRHLGRFATVEVVPAATPAADVLARKPDGVFLSNGPGDPEVVGYAVDAARTLVGEGVPLFGICLGHQILSLAIGARIVKLPFGHHGANHPVRNERTGHVEITSQNHNFAVDASSLGAVADATHVNLNDGVCEGLAVRGAPAFGVQHHPEGGPGPHDSAYLFQEFQNLMDHSSGSHH